MSKDPSASSAASADVPAEAEGALEQDHDIEARIVATVEDLTAASAVVEQKIEDRECADDLRRVRESLSRGIDEMREVETELTRSREALAQSQAALSAAQHEEQEARHRSLHDGATGLPNRNLFDDRLAHAISLAERHGWTLAVLFLDLDRFKHINDTHGHAAGDAVLKAVAGRLVEHARDEDTVCRNGGDEFLYLLVNPQGRDNVQRLAGRVRDSIARPMALDGLVLSVTPSIGIAMYPRNGTSGERLIRNADAAMYRAKKQPGRCAFFDALEADRVTT